MPLHKLLRRKGKLYVLDTSLFVNPQVRKFFGNTVDEAVVNFLGAAAKLKGKEKAEFFMPPSVRKELQYFAEKELPAFRSIIVLKSPSLYELKVPAILTYKLLDEIRHRVNAGLRVSEKFVREQKMPMEEKIHRLRQQYKSVLRDGIVDSEEDFEVIMLAKELNAAIITADLGLVKMAYDLGVLCISVEDFYEHFSSLEK